MRVRLEGKDQDITLEGPLLGRGGEASLYMVPGRSDLAAKIYHNPTDEHAAKLAAMLAAPPVAPPLPGQHVTLAWPIRRLLEPPPSSPLTLGGDEGGGRVIGYLMPRIEKAHLIWEIYNPGVRREICPHFHHGSLLRIARNLAAVVRTVHECGYVIGDLNESNVLVTPQGQVTLIDVDSFQTPGRDRLYRCRVGRPEYTPPELQGVAFADVDRLPQHDAFALAVLIFQLLMQGIHPFAGRCAGDGEPDSIAARIAAGRWPYAWLRTGPIQPSPHAPPWFMLPPSVQELLRRCFEDAHTEPDLRPSAEQWQHALEEAEHELTTCPHDAQHVYHRRLDRCPWCSPSSALRQLGARASRPCRAGETPALPTPNAENRKRKVVHDPMPPRQEAQPAASLPASGGVELVLQAIGASLERRGWLVWIGVALLGTVAGIVYALQRALPGKILGP
jgi:DNA-binding helix-hairpin-helix protein with protein kinase domain